MQTLQRFLRPAAISALAGLGILGLACGGNSTPADPPATSPTAQRLVYSDPSASGYRLLRDDSSTARHLVLKVVGPVGQQIQGGVFALKGDATKATWTSAGGSDVYVREGSALAMGSGIKLLKSHLEGVTLEFAIFQKGAISPATLGNEPILTVALDLKPGVLKGSLTLSADSAQILDASGAIQAVPLAVGILSAE